MDEDLYIRVINGEATDHPITGWNLRMFFSDLDPDNLPIGYERFTRVPIPELGLFQELVRSEYIKTNYGWTDNHIIQTVDFEKLSDTLSTEKISFPPKPDNGKEYFWSASAKKWIDYVVFQNVFGDFFTQNNIKYEDIDLKKMSIMTKEQKNQFKQLVNKYNNITGDK